MVYTDREKAEFKVQFRQRRFRQMLLVFPVLGAVVLMALVDEREALLGIPRGVIFGVGLALSFGALGFSLLNWRCPACSAYLGKSLFPKFCSKCGEQIS